MITALLLSGAIGLAMPAGDEPAANPSELAAYQSAAAAAGHDAGAHVRLALSCEAHGLTAERLEHLSLAVLYQPSNALARGLLGLVGYRGAWNRPEVIGEKIQNDPAYQALIREYLERRVRTPHTPEAQMKLATWCPRNG